MKYLGGCKFTLHYYLALSAQCSSDFREMLQGVWLYHRLGLSLARNGESGLQFACHMSACFWPQGFLWRSENCRSLTSLGSCCLPYSEHRLYFCTLLFRASAQYWLWVMYFVWVQSWRRNATFLVIHIGHREERVTRKLCEMRLEPRSRGFSGGQGNSKQKRTAFDWVRKKRNLDR